METSSLTFAEHPVQAFDPWYTKDYNLWHCAWDDYRSSIKQRLYDCKTRRDTHPILREFVETCDKIKAYERATGHTFISYFRTDGRMRSSRSYLRLLFD